MAYDGSILLDTKIDSSGAESGLNKLTTVAAAGAAAAGAAIAALGAAVIKVGSDFEAGMSKVQAISGASAGDMEKLTAIAKEMGEATKFSATESAEALTYMAMAGWKTEQMISGLPGIMNLAAASGEQLGLVSDIVTDALTGFGLAAEGSGRFADVLAAASNNANTNVAMLGESFKYVAPVAGALGYSVEDTSVALGLMANSGIKASQAGTALRTLLTNLVKPTDQMAAAMDDLGIELTNVDGTMKPLNQVMIEMRDSFSQLSESERAMYAATLAGKEGMSGLLAIVNASEDDFNKLTAAIDNSTGTAQRMADIMNDNLQGQLTLLGSALEGVGIQIYEQFQEPLKDATKSAISSVNSMSSAFRDPRMVNALQTLGNGFADLAAGAADLASRAIPALTSSLAFLVENGRTTASVIGAVASGFIAFKAASTVIPIVQGLSAAYAAASGTLALYSSAQAVAAGVDATAAISAATLSGALSVKEIVVAALTGKVTLATAAQGLWNAAIAANPIGAMALVIGVVVGALAGLAIALRDTESEHQRLIDSTDQLIEETERLNQSFEASEAAHEDNLRNIRDETEAADKLTDKIDALSKKENKSVADKHELASVVNQLNQLMPELNLQYDEQNDLLSKSTAEIYKSIDARRAMLEVQAREARQVEIINEIVDAENRLIDIRQQREEIEAQLDSTQENRLDLMQDMSRVYGSMGESSIALGRQTSELEQKIEQLNEKEEEELAIVDGLNAKYDEYQVAINEATGEIEAFSESTEKSFSNASEAVEGFSLIASDNIYAFINSLELSEDALDDHLDALEDYTAKASDAFGKIGEDAAVSLDQVKENLRYNIEAMENWSDNMRILAARGVDEGFLAQLRAAGPEARLTVQGLVNASDEELAELAPLMAGSAQAGINAYLTEFDRGSSTVPAEAIMLIESTKQAMDTAVEAGNFSETGANIINPVIDALIADAELSEAGRAKIEELRGALNEAAESGAFDESIYPVLDQISDALESDESVPDSAKFLWDSTKTQLESHIESNNLSDIGPKIFDPAVDSISANTALINALQGKVGEGAEAAKAAASAAGYGEAGIATVERAGEGAKLSSALIEALQDRAITGKEALDTAVEGAGFPESGDKLMEGTAQGVTDSTHMETAITEKTADIRDHADSEVENNRFQEVGDTLAEDEATGISDSTAVDEAVSEQIRDARTEADSAAAAAGFEIVGENISDGIATGIRNGASAVVSAVQNLISEALAAAREAADSHSPARRFMPLGEDIDEGVAAGIERSRYTAEASAELMQQAYAAMASNRAPLAASAITYNSSSVTAPVVNIDARLTVEGGISSDTDLDALSRKWGDKVANQARLKGVLAT